MDQSSVTASEPRSGFGARNTHGQQRLALGQDNKVEVDVERKLAEGEDVIQLGFAEGFGQAVQVLEAVALELAFVHVGLVYNDKGVLWYLKAASVQKVVVCFWRKQHVDIVERADGQLEGLGGLYKLLEEVGEGFDIDRGMQSEVDGELAQHQGVFPGVAGGGVTVQVSWQGPQCHTVTVRRLTFWTTS